MLLPFTNSLEMLTCFDLQRNVFRRARRCECEAQQACVLSIYTSSARANLSSRSTEALIQQVATPVS